METGIITSEIKKIWKKANDSITIWIKENGIKDTINEKSASVEFRCRQKVKGFDNTLDKSFFFDGRLPKIYNSACFSFLFDPISYGNMKALYMLCHIGDKLVFHCSDDRNQYMELAEIPLKNWKEEKDQIFHPNYKGLHNDCLFVDIYRKGKLILSNFELTNQQTPNNSARALRGFVG